MNITKPGTPPYCCHPTHHARFQPSFLTFPGHNNIADSPSSPLQHNLITGSVPIFLSLASGVSLGIHKRRFLLYRPLADLFGVEISFSLLLVKSWCSPFALVFFWCFCVGFAFVWT
jgi:hypothetical protein